MTETRKRLNPRNESDQLEIASQLYERYCDDLLNHSDIARMRLVSGIQIALRDATDNVLTDAPRKHEPLGQEVPRVGQYTSPVKVVLDRNTSA